MASVSEKKLKLLYLMELFYRQTDREHTLTLPVICLLYTSGGNGSGSGIPDRDIFDVCFPKAVSQKEEGRRR